MSVEETPVNYNVSGAPVYEMERSGVSRMLIPYLSQVDATVTQTEALIALAVVAGEAVGDMNREIIRFYNSAKGGNAESILAMQTIAGNLVAVIVGKPEAPAGSHDAYKQYVSAWRSTEEGKEHTGKVAVPGQRRRAVSSVLDLLAPGIGPAPRQTSAIARQRAEAENIARQAVAAMPEGDLAAQLRKQLEEAQKRR